MNPIHGPSAASASWARPAHVRGSHAQDPAATAAFADKLLRKLDSDDSGGIASFELDPLLQAMAAYGTPPGHNGSDPGQTFAAMDSNGDGSLDADELYQGLQGLLPPSADTLSFAQSRNAARADARLFNKLDQDGSVGVETSELSKALTDAIKPDGSAVTPDDIDQLMTKLDTDSSGSVSLEELTTALQAQRDEQRRAGAVPPGPPPELMDLGQADGGEGEGDGERRGVNDHGHAHRIGRGGPPPDGPPPPGGRVGGDGDGDDDSSGSTTAEEATTDATDATDPSTDITTDPMDSNGDGQVSPLEQAVGELKQALEKFALAAQAAEAAGTSSNAGSTGSSHDANTSDAVTPATGQAGNGNRANGLRPRELYRLERLLAPPPTAADRSGDAGRAGNAAVQRVVDFQRLSDRVLSHYAQAAQAAIASNAHQASERLDTVA